LNLYGATKMVLERIFGEANGWGSTRFIVTRYGNVVGSTGSIVPIFRDQLARSGRVRVTDPAMTRFWLAPDDAVDLISDCAAVAAAMGGSMIVPRPGAMAIGMLAELIAGGAPVDIIGPRPGEKVHEALVSEYESVRTTCVTIDGRDRMVVAGGNTAPLHGRDAGYSSDDPDFWISPEQMEVMIADAANI
jgi:UDP-N-acetylglucosamine 4,6-dehydratase